ncbi:dockerin type I domain-containing protein [Patescibacteria group bacterium]|nr:dockerin type I domain-containing protein [Patescibacteria group bacterium]
MNSELRIPTLFGLFILIASVVLGVFLVTKNQTLNTQAQVSQLPQEVNVSNITANSAAIYWYTDNPATGFVKLNQTGNSQATFLDERDSDSPAQHKFHFVTLTNLQPNTTYYYKIVSGTLTYPTNDWLNFSTGVDSQQTYPSIVGTVLNQNLQPTQEALVTLDIPGAQSLATVTKISGNFILPMNELKNSNLTQAFQIPSAGMSAKLTITDHQHSSEVTLPLPLINPVLNPIILGQNLDLSASNNIPTPTIQPAVVNNPNLQKYDLNQDGIINSLDLSLLNKNFSNKPTDLRFDLNGDGVVDQKDADLLKKFSAS